ncbi:MAG: hypothetical protein J3R72DRAFT_466224 [Linnemannia gamsii]|nr:MAG: hypothetical protein J3R72DRAFT_466224 [Linnemannia gamsii]
MLNSGYYRLIGGLLCLQSISLHFLIGCRRKQFLVIIIAWLRVESMGGLQLLLMFTT